MARFTRAMVACQTSRRRRCGASPHPRLRRPALAGLLALLVAGGLAGCGGAQPRQAEQPRAGEPAAGPASELDEAATDAEVQGAPKSQRGPTRRRVTSTPADDGKPGYAAPPSGSEATTVEQALADLEEDEELFMTALDDAQRAAELSGGDRGGPCLRACQALGSMRRSVTAVCRLAGDADARCARARSVLDRSEGRIADARCSCD